MRAVTLRVPPRPAPAAASSGELRLGHLIRLEDGRPLVQVQGGPAEPVIARVASSSMQVGELSLRNQLPVLLFLQDGDPYQPIIVGLVQDKLQISTRDTISRPAQTSDRSLVIDLDRIVLDGHEEVVLRCGQASITLRADGQVVIKGRRVVSRAAETNKIRGATVQIN